MTLPGTGPSFSVLERSLLFLRHTQQALDAGEFDGTAAKAEGTAQRHILHHSDGHFGRNGFPGCLVAGMHPQGCGLSVRHRPVKPNLSVHDCRVGACPHHKAMSVVEDAFLRRTDCHAAPRNNNVIDPWLPCSFFFLYRNIVVGASPHPTEISTKKHPDS